MLPVDLARLRALDHAEWAKVEKQYFRRVLYYVRKSVKDFQVCEDLTQDVFLSAIRAIDRYDEAYNIEQYLFGIARNKVIDHLRRGGRDEAMGSGGDSSIGAAELFKAQPARDPSPSRIVMEGEDQDRRRRALAGVLRSLVEEYWTKGEFTKLMAVELVFRKRLRHAEIARRLRLPDEKTVAGIKFRAIEKLQLFARTHDPHRTLFAAFWQ
jgi:RNA polymerase sigma-70 factor (ECF subfamily)